MVEAVSGEYEACHEGVLEHCAWSVSKLRGSSCSSSMFPAKRAAPIWRADHSKKYEAPLIEDSLLLGTWLCLSYYDY